MVIEQSKTLSELSLRKNYISASGFKALSLAFEKNTRLQLHLSGNSAGITGLKHKRKIAETIRKRTQESGRLQDRSSIIEDEAEESLLITLRQEFAVKVTFKGVSNRPVKLICQIGKEDVSLFSNEGKTAVKTLLFVDLKSWTVKAGVVTLTMREESFQMTIGLDQEKVNILKIFSTKYSRISMRHSKRLLEN
jgi:hypothetical protein